MSQKPLTDLELEETLSEVSHDLRNIASTCRAEAQLALIKFEKDGKPERMANALQSVIHQTDLMIQVLEGKLDRCRRRGLAVTSPPKTPAR